MATSSAGVSTASKSRTRRPVVRHAWSHHWPVLVAGAVTVMTVGLLLTLVLVTTWPVKPVDARIEVTAQAIRPSGTLTIQVSNRTSSVVEAIARFSDSLGQPTRYVTVGASAYLVTTLGQENDLTGRWHVWLNGHEIEDLAAATLKPGDQLQLKHLPNP